MVSCVDESIHVGWDVAMARSREFAWRHNWRQGWRQVWRQEDWADHETLRNSIDLSLAKCS